MKIAVIGAGLAGATVAQQLRKHASVSVFEKSRGVGGRMSSRRSDAGLFDHGAQFFTARSAEFQASVKALMGGDVIEWKPKLVSLEAGERPYKRLWYEAHWIANPTMNALAKSFLADQELRLQCHIGAIKRRKGQWLVIDDNDMDQGSYDWVILTAPAPQTYTLLPVDCVFREIVGSVAMAPCCALMLAFTETIPLNFAAAKVHDSPLAWIAVNSGKPGRSGNFSLVLHSDNDWAAQNLELPETEIIDILLRCLREFVPFDSSSLCHIKLHRWRYARTTKSAGEDYLIDCNKQLAVCADWCRGERVEDAFLSASALARRLRG